MKRIEEKFKENIYDSSLWNFYFQDLRTIILDIETTGLSPQRDRLILGGYLDVKEGNIHQILASDREEEWDVIKLLCGELEEADMIVTYNGDNFDLPFIERRGGRLKGYSLDLYRVAKRFSPIGNLLPNMKQKTVENYMGLWDRREDEISGRESLELFNFYERTGDEKAEEKILLHNRDDVKQLARLTSLVTKCDFHKAMFTLGFPVKVGNNLLATTSVRFRGERLEVEGRQLKGNIQYVGFDYKGIPLYSDFSGDSFTMSIPIIERSGMSIVDVETLGPDMKSLEDYPQCSDGFLVLRRGEEIYYRQTNDFLKGFIKDFLKEIGEI